MTAHLPALIVVLPLTAALLAPAAALVSSLLVRALVLLALLAAHASSVAVLARTLAEGKWHYNLGGWAPPWGIEYVVDPLGAGMATLISCIGLLAAVYAGPYLRELSPLRKGSFYSLFLLLTAGLLGMVVTGDVFNLYVFLEISALAAYALIAFGGDRAVVAAFRYLIVGTVAASLYLLGVGFLYAVTGTLNMADLAVRLPPLLDSRALSAAVALIVVGFGIKAALFPLHGWLPDAYSYASAPVVVLVSAVMAKVSAYALYRILFFVIGPVGPVAIALDVIGWAAAAGIIFGSVMAMAQRDLWRMLAYSSVAQMGYILLGLSLANDMGLYGALLHILNHAVMKGCLFMIAGGVRWQTGIRDIPGLVGLSRRMPFTTAALVVAALSMIGLPPTAGFFSKWYLVRGSIEAGAWPFVLVIALSSLLTAVYFFRVIEESYLRRRAPRPAGPEAAPVPAPELRELPAAMLVPVLLLGAGILGIGVWSEQIVSRVIRFALPWGVP